MMFFYLYEFFILFFLGENPNSQLEQNHKYTLRTTNTFVRNQFKHICF